MREREFPAGRYVTLCAGSLLLVLLTVLFPGCAASQQPRSPLKYRPVELVEWVWSGALSARSIRIRAKLAEGIVNPVLLLSNSERFQPASRYPASFVDDANRVATFDLGNLAPQSVYYYAVEADGRIDLVRSGRFQTMADGAFSFSVAFGCCARTGSNAAIFDTILQRRPLMFLHLGDFHYSSVASRNAAPYRQALDHVLASPAQSRLYREVPIVYVWDDHDFGANNSNRENPGLEAVHQAYREYVPHYPLALEGASSPICQSFQVGRVLFLITDGRSARDPSKVPGRSMLGSQQVAWLKRMFSEAENFPLTVWVNNSTWIAPAVEGGDDWGGFEAERQELSRSISGTLASRMVMLCGDAHMLALDDGSHSDFSGEPQPRRFPVFHAAPLDQEEKARGGPFSHGQKVGLGFFGLVTVEDSGNQLKVTLSGRDWMDREVISYSFGLEQGIVAIERGTRPEPAG